MKNISVNDTYDREDGSRVRVDFVENGQIYFVQWFQHEEHGQMRRMDIADFEAAIVKEGMRRRLLAERGIEVKHG